jgi:hypothetical protein
MNRAVLPVLVFALLAGCAKKVDNSPSFAKSAVDRATSATQPQAITLTNQTMVYECPKCGADYDKAGQCPMDQTELVAMQVSYICPADNQPVEQAGKCPRCNANARIDKVALNGAGGGTGTP